MFTSLSSRATFLCIAQRALGPSVGKHCRKKKVLHKSSRACWLIFIVNKRKDTWICNSWQFVILKGNLTLVISYVCPGVENEFRHSIAEVVCKSTQPSPCWFTATLTMLWRNSSSVAGQSKQLLLNSSFYQLVISGHDVTRVLNLHKQGYPKCK